MKYDNVFHELEWCALRLRMLAESTEFCIGKTDATEVMFDIAKRLDKILMKVLRNDNAEK